MPNNSDLQAKNGFKKQVDQGEIFFTKILVKLNSWKKINTTHTSLLTFLVLQFGDCILSVHELKVVENVAWSKSSRLLWPYLQASKEKANVSEDHHSEDHEVLCPQKMILVFF